MKYFFRAIPDSVTFRLFGPAHLLLIFAASLGTYLIYKCKDKIRHSKHYTYIKTSIAIILIAQQTILYTWYYISGYSSVKESLPLYNCRIAIIFTALALITSQDFYKHISIYWGIYGAILSIIVVEGDPFSFPHFTTVSFFVGHTLLLWGAALLIFVDEYVFNKSNLNWVLKFTTIHHVLLLFLNIILKSNYDYLIEPPILKEIYYLIPQFLYSIIAILIYDLLILITYLIFTKEKSLSVKLKAS